MLPWWAGLGLFASGVLIGIVIMVLAIADDENSKG